MLEGDCMYIDGDGCGRMKSKASKVGYGRVRVESKPWRTTGEQRWRRRVLTAKSKHVDIGRGVMGTDD